MDPTRPPLLRDLSPLARILFAALLTISSFAILFLLGMILAGPLFGIGLQEMMTSLSDTGDPKVLHLLEYFQCIQAVGLFIVPALLAAYLFARNPWLFLGLDKGFDAVTALVVVALMFASLPVVNWMITANEAMQLPGFLKGVEEWMKNAEEQAGRLTDSFMEMPTVGSFLFNMVMIAVLPAVGEELLFRGLLQRLFRDWLKSPHAAIFLAAFLFSAMHLQFYGFLPRFALGLMFGYLYLWSGSLWVPVFAHFLNNGSAVAVAWLGQTGVLQGDYKEFGATDNPLWIAAGAVITAVLLFTVYRRRAAQ